MRAAFTLLGVALVAMAGLGTNALAKGGPRASASMASAASAVLGERRACPASRRSAQRDRQGRAFCTAATCGPRLEDARDRATPRLAPGVLAAMEDTDQSAGRRAARRLHDRLEEASFVRIAASAHQGARARPPIVICPVGACARK